MRKDIHWQIYLLINDKGPTLAVNSTLNLEGMTLAHLP